MKVDLIGRPKEKASSLRRAWPSLLVALLCASWCSVWVYDARNTHAMPVDEAIRALRSTSDPRDAATAVAALRRRAFDAIRAIRTATDGPASIEANAAIAALREEMAK